jgi:co-chaperonin GroES (HSP10)
MNKKLQDLVWSILPKEFKEEVKKLYTDALDASNSPHEPDDRKWGNYRVTLLEKLFGYHNLTSDGEGEEMLTVSRKEVMRNFAEKVAWKNHHQSSKHDRDMAAGWCNALHFLFGPKCLPDENKECSNPSVVNCKHKHGDGTCSLSGMCCYKSPKPAEPEEKDDCKKFTKRLDDTLEGDIKEPFKEWRDKNSSNVEKLEKNGEVEPKPAKPKFKVGDKVRYKEFVGTVYQIEETDYVIRKLAGGDLIGWLKESDLEPYTEPTNEDFVTLGVESAEYLRKSLEESEYRNSSQNTANCDKHFDNILKDGFSKERRLNIAKDFASVLLSRLNYDPFTAQINCCCSGGAAVNPYLNIARIALSVADALIAESEKGGEK